MQASEYDYSSLFEIGKEDGVIRLARSLDRETVEIIRLSLLCVDEETTVKGLQVAKTTLTIIVEDTNDNDPKFRKPFYKRSVAENTEIGTLIVTVVADDVDKNKTISYSIQVYLILGIA